MTERFKPFAAAYLLLMQDDQVLLMRRQGSIYFNDWYGLPSGHLEDGETLRECLVREIKEELTIDLMPVDLSFAHLLHRYSATDDLGQSRQYLDAFFRTTRWQGEVTIGEPTKCDDLLWAPLSDLPENTVPFMREVLELIAKETSYAEYGWKHSHD